jgi:hypothetical protein
MRLLWGLLLFSALPLVAMPVAEPFTGTWKSDVSKAKFSTKADKIELANGTYKCSTCDPPISVKADGTDQPVTGHPGYDTMSVRIIDDHNIEVVAKKAGTVVFDEKTSVAADGMTATEEFTTHPQSSDKPVTGTVTLKRAGKSMAGMHAVSGAWVAEKAENVSENGLVVTFEETADGLKMSQPTGDHFDAKLDGKDYPFEGSAEVNKVVLKRIGPRVIEEIDKRDEKVESTERMTVSPDGHTMTIVVKDRQGRVSTFVWDKQ